MVGYSQNQEDVENQMTKYFESNGKNSLKTLFTEKVLATLLADEKMYKPAELSLWLNKFVSDHPIQSVKTIHKINSRENFQVLILSIKTGSGNKYRATITSKSEALRSRIVSHNSLIEV